MIWPFSPDLKIKAYLVTYTSYEMIVSVVMFSTKENKKFFTSSTGVFMFLAKYWRNAYIEENRHMLSRQVKAKILLFHTEHKIT